MWGITSAQYGQPTSGLILTGWGVFFCPLRRKLLHFTTNLGETFRISFFLCTPQANKRCPSCTNFSSHNNSQQHSLTLWEFHSTTKDPFKVSYNKETGAHQQPRECGPKAQAIWIQRQICYQIPTADNNLKWMSGIEAQKGRDKGQENARPAKVRQDKIRIPNNGQHSYIYLSPMKHWTDQVIPLVFFTPSLSSWANF